MFFSNSFKYFNSISFRYLIFSFLIYLCFAAPGCKNSKNNHTDGMKKLGQLLFFENRLSHNGTKSCSSCHDPRFAFTDGYRTSITSNGEHVLRNAPTLLNISNYRFYNWANNDVTSLTKQHIRPLFGKSPVELGLHLDSQHVFKTLAQDPKYKAEMSSLHIAHLNESIVINALASYVNALQSRNSEFDRYIRDTQAPAFKEIASGYRLFKESGCADCHPAPDFTTNHTSVNSGAIFRKSKIGEKDSGLYSVTRNEADLYKFRIPTLRNAGITSPYFHDGSAQDLKAVLQIHPGYPDEKKRQQLTPEAMQSLIKFIHSLTDTGYLHHATFKNPFHE